MKFELEVVKFNIADVVTTSSGTGCTPPDTVLPCPNDD